MYASIILMQEVEEYGTIAQVSNYKFYKQGIYIGQLWKYVCTQVAFGIGMALYYIFTAGYVPIGLLILTVIAHIGSKVLLAKFAFTDPGIVRKITDKYYDPTLSYIPENKCIFKSIERNKDTSPSLVVKTHFLPLRLCKICLIYKAPRMEHCYDCNVCVEKFDHHCPWLGNCIAKRNYRLFMFIILSLSVLFMLVFIQSILVIDRGTYPSTGYKGMNVVILILSGVVMLFLLSLVLVHSILVCNNITTKECCRGYWNVESGNPFRKSSALKNFTNSCCIKMSGKPKSDPFQYVVARKKVQFQLDNQVMEYYSQSTKPVDPHSQSNQTLATQSLKNNFSGQQPVSEYSNLPALQLPQGYY